MIWVGCSSLFFYTEKNSRCVASVHIDEVTPRLSFLAQHYRRGNTTLAGHGYPRRCCESTNSSALSKSNKRAWRCSTTPLLPSLGCLIIAVETRPTTGLRLPLSLLPEPANGTASLKQAERKNWGYFTPPRKHRAEACSPWLCHLL